MHVTRRIASHAIRYSTAAPSIVFEAQRNAANGIERTGLSAHSLLTSPLTRLLQPTITARHSFFQKKKKNSQRDTGGVQMAALTNIAAAKTAAKCTAPLARTPLAATPCMASIESGDHDLLDPHTLRCNLRVPFHFVYLLRPPHRASPSLRGAIFA